MKRTFLKNALTYAAAIMTAAVLAGPAAAQNIVMDGSTTVGPIAKAFSEYYMKQNKGVNVTVSESGSGNGAKSLINKSCQIATMSRFMKDEEFKAAVDAGVFPVAHAVALDGVAVIVHPSNPLKNLTVEQARAIYTGKITNWKQLGGSDLAIVSVSRDTNSGTYETFEGLIMNKEKIGAGAEYVGSNGGIRQRVQSTPGAIGYAGLGFVDDTVKALSINGIAPSSATVRAGVYPVARALFMFTNGYPALGSNVYDLVTMCQSETGSNIIQETGFIPMTEY
jgi:phosphate transport system substrate-binding protein